MSQKMRNDFTDIGGSTVLRKQKTGSNRSESDFRSEGCNSDCESYAEDCIARLEEEEEEARQAQNKARIDLERSERKERIGNTPPIMVLACGRFEITVWKSDCGFGYPKDFCIVSDGQIEFYDGNYTMTINRVTGILERYDADGRESIACDVASSTTRKF